MFNQMMKYAIEEAKSADGEVPVGAIIVKDGNIIARASNCMISSCNPTAHAEIEVIKKAAQIIGEYRLEGCHLYVTLEPCPMCAFAISLARIDSLYIGSRDYKTGAVLSKMQIYNTDIVNHRPKIYDCIMQEECDDMILNFFKNRR